MTVRRGVASAGVVALLFGGAGMMGAGPLLLVAHADLQGCVAPTITVVGNNGHAARGSTVAVSGNGFDESVHTLCLDRSLRIQINGVTFPLGNISPSGATFTLSQAVDGAVTVLDAANDASNANLVFVTDPIPGNLPATPPVGQPLSATGTGYDLGGRASGATVSWQTKAGSCPVSSATVAQGGGSVSVPALGAYCSGVASLNLSWLEGGASRSLTVPLGSVDVAPALSGASPAEAAAGAPFTVHGTGFGTVGSAKVGGVSAVSVWTDTAVAVTLPDAGVGGAVSITRVDGMSIAAGSVIEDARIDSVSPRFAMPGSPVTVVGGGFGPTAGSLNLGSTPLTPTAWSGTSVTFTLPQGAQSGEVTLKPASGAAGTSPLIVAAVLAGVSPAHGPAGTLVQLSGTGFGGTAGTVSVGGREASVSLWGDTSVVATIPAGIPAGATAISIQPAGQGPLATGFTIDPGVSPASPTSTSSSSSSAPASSTSSGPSFIAPSANGPVISTGPVAFQKPPAPAGPVSLTLAAPATSGDPGQSVLLSVALVAFGKPVAGAKVDFLLVVEPGRDAALDPAQAVTDADGHATATLHLSATPGDHIVLARSGQYSDEVSIASRGAGGAAVASLGGARGSSVVATVSSGPPKVLVVGGLVACLILFLAGFVIQVLVPRSRPAGSVIAGAGGAAAAGCAWRPFGAAERAATVLQFAGTVALLAAVLPPARLVQRLVRKL